MHAFVYIFPSAHGVVVSVAEQATGRPKLQKVYRSVVDARDEAVHLGLITSTEHARFMSLHPELFSGMQTFAEAHEDSLLEAGFTPTIP